MSPPIWALLVTIQTYAQTYWPKVEGAPVDAENVSRYLKTDLSVPEDHIVWLADNAATREGIISMFQKHLIDNDRIKSGDAILFYFSGHGCSLEAPNGWIVDDNTVGDEEDGMIEAIMPWDEGIIHNGDTATCAIPDRTLAALINGAASQHGNNITVVLDCCCSGHGTRSEKTVVLNGEVLLPRAVDPALLTPLKSDTDQEILSRPSSPLASILPLPQTPVSSFNPPLELEQTHEGDSSALEEEVEVAKLASFNHSFDQYLVDQLRKRASDLVDVRRRGRFRALATSHVLLAACKPRESAMGGSSGGILTTLWIPFMKSNNVHPRTYAELVKRINLQLECMPAQEGEWEQHPQCEGIVRDRIIFEETMVKTNHFRARKRSNEDNFAVEAGTIHGVLVGTEFEIYALNSSLQGDAQGTARAVVVDSMTSIVHAESFSQWKRPKDFMVYTASIIEKPKLRYQIRGTPSSQHASIALHQFYEALMTESQDQRKVSDHDDDADVQICFEPDGCVQLRRLDPLLSTLPNPTPRLTAREIEKASFDKILKGIARFNWLLPQTNATQPFAQNVTFEMFCLVRDSNTGFLKKAEQPVKTTGYGIEVTENDEYAMVLRNNSLTDLFVQVWYFDPDSYSIECLYEQANETHTTLRANGGTLQLGASTELSWPLTYYLPKPGSRSTLFTKVFLTDRHVKLSSLYQEALIGPEADHGRAAVHGEVKTQGLWDAILQPITVQ